MTTCLDPFDRVGSRKNSGLIIVGYLILIFACGSVSSIALYTHTMMDFGKEGLGAQSTDDTLERGNDYSILFLFEYSSFMNILP